MGPSHPADVPAPGFTTGKPSAGWQALLVWAIPVVPAIAIAMVIFWPRNRRRATQGRSA